MAIIGLTTDIKRLESRMVEVDMRIRSASIDKELIPFVMEFDRVMQDAGIDVQYGSLVVIQFKLMRHGLLGVAHGMNHNVTMININPREWVRLSTQDKRMVIFHEMAHDVFNLHHGSIGLMDTPMPMFVTKDKVDSYMVELIKHIKNGR